MSTVTKAPYVFIARGKVLFSGDSPEELFDRVEEQYLGGAAVKGWRVHTWVTVEGIYEGVLACLGCKEQRRADGANGIEPCPFPEKFDPSITVIKPSSGLLYNKN